jgi:hypothetical protein
MKGTFMKYTKLLSVVAVSFALVACDDTVKLTNGELPAEYIPYAQPLVGQYRGQIDRKDAEINLALNGNKIVYTGTDPVAPACQSKVGDALKITYKKNNGSVQITSATFAFDAGLCRANVQGDTLYMSFENNAVDVSLLERSSWRTECDDHYVPGPPGTGGHWRHSCRQVAEHRYISGRLVK